MLEDLRINEIHYDSPTEVSGQAMTPNNAVTETHTGEYIVLYNISLEPMDLSPVPTPRGILSSQKVKQVAHTP